MRPWHMVLTAQTPSLPRWLRTLTASVSVCTYCNMYVVTCTWLSCFHVNMHLNCKMNFVHIVQFMYVSVAVTPWHLGRINCLLNKLAYSEMTPGTWRHGFRSSSNLTKVIFSTSKKQILDKPEIGRWQTLNSPDRHYHEIGDGLSSRCT